MRCCTKLAAAELLDTSGSAPEDIDLETGRRRGRATIGRERAADRDWQRFQDLNARMRQDVRAFEDEEEERAIKRVRVVSVQQNGTIPPLALGMIVAAAQQFDGGRLNAHYGFHPDWLMRATKVRALADHPAIYLMSNYNWSHRHNSMVSKKVKQLSPWSVTIHGGPNTPKYQADSEAYFRNNPDVDVTVRGEGEATISHILSALIGRVGDGPPDLSPLADVPGLSVRLGNRIIRTPDRERIADLDTIPSPVLGGLFAAYEGTSWRLSKPTEAVRILHVLRLGSAIATRIRSFRSTACLPNWNGARNTRCRHHGRRRQLRHFRARRAIAEKIADLKRHYGYPNGFSVSAAKNTTKHTKRIIEILSESGVMSKGSIGVQSTDRRPLAAVKRFEHPARQAAAGNKFRDSGLPLWVDLMFGLPGQTMASFRNDLQGCINRGVFPRMFMTELLVNSPMNEPDYRELHQIKTEPTPDGARNLVVSTASFTRHDYDEMNDLRLLFLLCDVIGMLRHIAHYVRSETGLREIDFYERLRRDLRDDPETWPTLAFSVRAIPSLLIPPVSWHLAIQEARRYVVDVIGLPDDAALATVLATQRAVLPARDRRLPETVQLPHDYATWHRTMVEATEAGHQEDWHQVVPKLRTLGPGSLTVDDPDRLCTLGIGAAVDGDFSRNYELRSSVARWTRPDESARRPAAAAV